tara:strand:- start:31 stop:447 length:417 start_codon:yes stop_codon:yes gene_type:complete
LFEIVESDLFFGQYRKVLAMNIRRLRKAKRISADDMANVLNMSVANYYKIEGEGAQAIKAEWLPVIAAKFAVSINDLFGQVPSNRKKIVDEEELVRTFRGFEDKNQIAMLQLVKEIRSRSLNEQQLNAIAALIRTIHV